MPDRARWQLNRQHQFTVCRVAHCGEPAGFIVQWQTKLTNGYTTNTRTRLCPYHAQPSRFPWQGYIVARTPLD